MAWLLNLFFSLQNNAFTVIGGEQHGQHPYINQLRPASKPGMFLGDFAFLSHTHETNTQQSFFFFPQMNENNDNTQDAFTHPMLYRESVNSPKSSQDQKLHQKGCQCGKKQAIKFPAPKQEKEEPCWDCYPHIARKIENEGTPEQVEQLHEMEHRSPR